MQHLHVDVRDDVDGMRGDKCGENWVEQHEWCSACGDGFLC